MAEKNSLFFDVASSLINETSDLIFALATAPADPDDTRTAFTLKVFVPCGSSKRCIGYVIFRVSTVKKDDISTLSNVKIFNRNYICIREFRYDATDENAFSRYMLAIKTTCRSLSSII